MNIRKHTITLNFIEKTKETLLPQHMINNGILQKFSMIDTFIKAKIDNEEYQGLKKRIIGKIPSFLYAIVKSKNFPKTLYSLKQIKNATQAINGILKNIDLLVKIVPDKSLNKNIAFLDKLISSLENLPPYLNRIVQELNDIEGYVKEKHPDLSKEIGDYKGSIRLLSEDLLQFKTWMKFYFENINTILSKRRKIGHVVLVNSNKTDQVKLAIEESNKVAKELKVLLKKSNHKLSVINNEIDELPLHLKENLTKNIAYGLVKHDINTHIELIKMVSDTQERLRNHLCKNKTLIKGYKVDFEDECVNSNKLLDTLNAHFRIIKEKSVSLNFAEDINIISQNIFKVSLVGVELEKISTKMESLESRVNGNFTGAKEHLLQAKELNFKIDQFSIQLTSLVHLHHSLESGSTSEAEMEPLSSCLSKLNSIDHFTQNQSKGTYHYLKKAIINHHWEISIVSPRGTLIDNRKTDGTLKLNTIHLKIAEHANKMLRVFNRIEKISKIHTQEFKIDYTSAISEINTITQSALDKPHFFRAVSTDIIYRRIKNDIAEAKRLSQLKNPDELLSIINGKIENPAFNDDEEHTAERVVFVTKIKKILLSENIPSSDKLMKIHQKIKNYFYNENLVTNEKKYIANMLLALLQINANRSLENIKDEIIYRCKKHKSSVYIGGEVINIDDTEYTVPRHIKIIWQKMIDCEVLDQDGKSKVASVKKSQPSNDYLVDTLCEVICISENAMAKSSFLRGRNTQNFYMDIANSKTFLSYLDDKEEINHLDSRPVPPDADHSIIDRRLNTSHSKSKLDTVVKYKNDKGKEPETFIINSPSQKLV